MRFNRLIPAAVAASAVLFSGIAFSQDRSISDYFKNSGKAPKLVAPPQDETPQWLRDSRRLNELLGSNPNMRIENPKVVHKVPKVFGGLDAYVVEGTEFSEDHPDGKVQLYFFYADAAMEHLFVGMVIDMKRGRDVSMDMERYLRGQLAENPAKALRPQEMHGIELPGGKTTASPLTFVVDLGPKEGRDSFLNLVKLHRSMMAAGENPRAINFIFVSNAKNEFSTGAMAIGYGAQAVSRDGIARLVEFAEQGEKTAWLQPRKMNADNTTKQLLGTGAFKLESNSTQAMLARLSVLPLIYTGTGGKMANAPLPQGAENWRKLLASK